ncbi:MAG: FtsL-like putative cell division protein [Bacteroidales bacterium]|jgi:hypothetical protein|nr:FtsL-like putative cell division protein [Bacteroidales bacterium]MDD2204083.1 FtsL-like putative cell division protein [Bacteroidales bacterium]MDD3151779.1 FtsL-like putative cell division protein [Bacteroidales bacterium]MDD3913747.1 FtsL-like putative cell division protein [Bacteroidales bacterium]MDD4633512.1 FtsL-like putative cell division protein [Bacteroidales bacterium]
MEEIKKNKRDKKNSRVAKGIRSFLSGNYLFTKNMRKSPIWIIIYCVFLIIIIIGLRYEPIKRYNNIELLNKTLIEKTIRNNEIKAKITYYGSLSNLQKDFKQDGVQSQPVIIKVNKE